MDDDIEKENLSLDELAEEEFAEDSKEEEEDSF